MPTSYACIVHQYLPTLPQVAVGTKGLILHTNLLAAAAAGRREILKCMWLGIARTQMTADVIRSACTYARRYLPLPRPYVSEEAKKKIWYIQHNTSDGFILPPT